MELETLLGAVGPEYENARAAARARWNACAKPLGGLGLLETAVEDIAALTGNPEVCVTNRAVVVCCADNGVVEEGVSQSPSSVTGLVARNLARGCTPVCRMARTAGCQVIPVDLGVKDLEPLEGILPLRIGNGTGNIAMGPAMTREEAEQAILTGVDLVRELKRQGMNLIAAGEVGIGNTTTAAAVTSVLLDREPEEVTGRGAGLSDGGLIRKVNAIRRAIAVNRPEREDPLGVLAKLGGYDVGCMCGLFLGGAIYEAPVLMDGVISAAAALCAVRLCPKASKAILASHLTAEPAGGLLLEALGKKPLITAGLHLGEGTGAVAAMPLLDMALAVYYDSCTFEGCGLEAYQPLGGELGSC